MTLIATNNDLIARCQQLKEQAFITVDTEFLRDRYYYPKLCVIQIGYEDGVFAIDPLSESLNLEPIFELFQNKRILKVFHAARQDIEIIYNHSGNIPTPIFDTQVAGMVCGFGAAASYAKLVNELTGNHVDKSSRFTDWSRRPLSDKQLHYALSDVSYLRQVYVKLNSMLIKQNRQLWLTEEMAALTDPKNYVINPDDMWKKLNPKSNSPRFLLLLQKLAAWREITAQKLNKPRPHVIRDQVLLEIAAMAPNNITDLKRIRGIGKINSIQCQQILSLVNKVLQTPKDKLTILEKGTPTTTHHDSPIIDLLRVLLKIQCAKHQVATKLVATNDELGLIATQEKADVPAMHGWRYEIFGQFADQLKQGTLALCAKDNEANVISL